MAVFHAWIMWPLFLMYCVHAYALDSAEIKEVSLFFHPPEHNVVLSGYRSSLVVEYESSSSLDTPLWLGIQAEDERLVRVLTDHIPLPQNQTGLHSSKVALEGLQQGHTTLHLALLTVNHTVLTSLTQSYRVTVVNHVPLLQDYLLQASCAAKILVIILLGAHLRLEAVLQVVRRPIALLASILCQTVLLPLVVLGTALSLDMHIHELVAMLVTGCCPTALLTPLLAVLHHSSMDLALLITMAQTVITFGTLPLWLYTCGHLLGLQYSRVFFPYWPLVVSLAVVLLPMLLGLALQLCVPKKALQCLDRVVHPACLVVTLFTIATSAYGFWDRLQLITWKLAVCVSVIPIICFLVGGLTGTLLRQSFPCIKLVSISTCIRHTAVASVIVRLCYPAPDGSLMDVTISCVSFAGLAWILLLYFIHVITWTVSLSYRGLHGDLGPASKIYHSLTDHLVHSMVKAGEISFRSKQTALAQKARGRSPTLSERALVPLDQHCVGLDSLGFGNKVLAVCRDSIRRSGQDLPPRYMAEVSSRGSSTDSNSHPSSPDSFNKSVSPLSVEYEPLQARAALKSPSSHSASHDHNVSDSSKTTFTVSSYFSDGEAQSERL